MNKQPPLSLTIGWGGLVRVLACEIQISEAWDPASGTAAPAHHKFMAIWDTGASNTAITQKVADTVGLTATGKTTVNTANGPRDGADTFLVNVLLPNGVGFTGVRVTEGTVFGADVLIGMDIIGRGDFAVTCSDGKTCMSFRMPSMKKLDFVAEDRANQPKQPQQHNRMKKNRQKMPWDR